MANATPYDRIVLRAASWLEADGYPPHLPDDLAPIIVRAAALRLRPDFSEDAAAELLPRREWTRLARQAHGELLSGMPEICDALGGRFGSDLRAAAESVLRAHGERLAGLAADLLTSRPLAPPVRFPIKPTPLSERGHLHAILFEAWPHATHELLPLFVDALSATVNGLFPGSAVAAHTSWLLPDGSLRRALYLDAGADRLAEADLTHRRRIGSAHLLLGPVGDEPRWHAYWSGRLAELHVPLVNPLAGASLADDKWNTYRRWTGAGVATPGTWFVSRRAAPGARRMVCDEAIRAAARRLVVKPRHGTEGALVQVVPPDQAPLLRAVDQVLPHDDALIQRYHGCLRWASDGDADDARAAVIRLNVAFGADGMPRAESGYAHLAPDSSTAIASAGRAGTLAPLVREQLFLALQDAPPRSLSQAEVERIVELAERAAQVLRSALSPAEAVRLAGVDVLVEADRFGGAHPVALEVNPRPAGLSHSRFLTAAWEQAGEPGVSLRLWEGFGDTSSQ